MKSFQAFACSSADCGSAAINHCVSLHRAGKRRHGQRGRSGESEDVDEPVRRRHQEPVEGPGDPGMLHSEEGVPALRLGQVVSVNRAQCALKGRPLKRPP